MALPSLDILKNLFLEQLDYISENDTILQPANQEQLNILRDAAKKVTTITQLGALLMVPKTNANAGFKPIAPFDKDALYYTQLQFYRSNIEWYFMYGNCQDFAFTFIIFAIPICNETIAKKYNMTGNQVTIYSLSGGFGQKGGPWSTIPYMFCQANYQVASQAMFSWTGIFDTNSSPIKSASLTSNSVGEFDINITWAPYSALDKTDLVGIQATLFSPNGPFLNGPKGCCPCIAGLGTSYYSYVFMNIPKAMVGLLRSPMIANSGIGWFDHQWLQGGMVHDDPTIAATLNLKNYFKTPVVTRWFWLTMQDIQNNVQYMTSVMLSDVLTSGTNMEVDTKSTIKYNATDGPKYLSSDTTTVKILATTTVNGVVFPTKHQITINEGDKQTVYILQANYGNSIVYLPGGTLNWEGSGILYGQDGKTILGNAFLEANQLESEDSLLQTIGSIAGIDKNNYDKFSLKNSKVPGFVVFLSLMWFIFLIIVYIFIFWCIYKLIKLGWSCVKTYKNPGSVELSKMK
jgi:hypothetical protein